MGKKSKVSWAHNSHGFWYGCREVRQGCVHCYAKRQMAGKFDFRVVTRAAGFDKPLSWKEPSRVFVCPWSDFFIEEADPWRDDAWSIIRQTPHLDYIILTKRPQNILHRLPDDWDQGYPNVWLGVSVELQRWVSRIAILLLVPSAVHVVSAEPLLGPLDLRSFLADPYGYGPTVDWVIAGGESGRHQKNPKIARLMRMEWARGLRDQCAEAGVAFWFKQDADVRPEQRQYIVEEDGTQTVYQELPK